MIILYTFNIDHTVFQYQLLLEHLQKANPLSGSFKGLSNCINGGFLVFKGLEVEVVLLLYKSRPAACVEASDVKQSDFLSPAPPATCVND